MSTQPQPTIKEPSGAAASTADQRIKRTRRRALLVIGAILLVLAFAGLGEIAGSLIPHQTPAFANGRTQMAGTLLVTLQLSPNPPKVSGSPATEVQIALQGQNGQHITGAHVEVSLVMLTMDMGINDTHAQERGQGQYQASVAFLMPGAWQITITVAPSGGASVSTTFDVSVSR